MTTLKVTNSQETTSDPKKILQAQHDFYRELYSSDENKKFTLENNSQVKLTIEDRYGC